MWKMIVFIIIIGLSLVGCSRYAYYYPSGCVLEEYADNVIPKVGDIKSSCYGGIVTEVNIHGKQKGAISNYGIPYAEQEISPNSENLTYVYYDYIVKTDKWSKEYRESQ